MGLSAPPPPTPGLTRRGLDRARRAAALPAASVLGRAAAFVQIALAATLVSAWLEQPTVVAVTVVALGGAIVVGEVSGLALRFEKASGVVVACAALAVLFVAHAVTDARLLGAQPWVPFLVVALVPIGLDWHFAPRLRARVVASGLVVVPLVGTGAAWALAGALVWFLAALVTLAVLQRDAERAVLRPACAANVPLATGRWRYADIARIAAIGIVLGAAVALAFGDLSCSSSPARPGSVATGSGSGGSVSRPVPLPPGAGASPGDSVDPSSVIVEHDGETVTLRRGDGTSTVYEFDAERGQIHVTERDEAGAVVDRYSIDADDIETLPDGTAVAPAPAEREDEPTRAWLVLGALVVAAGLVALGWWWWSRVRPSPGPDDWAHRMAARLAHEGGRRGRARGAGETVEAHARALADGPLPDPRVVTVGRLVSVALFGPHPPDADRQAWADAAVDDVVAQHPAPRRRSGRVSRRRLRSG